MFNKIKTVKDMRDKAKRMQNILSKIEEEGEASWGKVKIKLNGSQEVMAVEIADEMLQDKIKLQEAIKDAFKDATKKLHRKMALKMKDSGGLDLLKSMDF